MSNSPLVNYIKISPNKTSPRKSKIDTITIHCVVGQVTVERLGEIFAPTSRQASCNYGIGYDGKIGMYCEEKDRSWCSGGKDKKGNPIRVNGISGADNDHRAITIEVASDTKHPYSITDKAYASLINLLADICKRNDIKELKWQGNKSLVGQINQQNMTVHRWFANKACPGDYLYERHGQIASEVNAKLKTTVLDEGTISNIPSSSEATIYNWLKSNTTLNTAAICGILANLDKESSFNSINLQNSYEKKLGYTDITYTSAVDSGRYKNFVRDSAGYGLCQWTYWSRKEALLEYAKEKDTSVGDYRMQLEYLLKELKSYKRLWSLLTTCADTELGAHQCGYQFCYDFEAPANKAESSVARGNTAKEYYNKYSKSNIVETKDTTVTYDSIEEGDIFEFTGNKQYSSANASTGSSINRKNTMIVKVTKKYNKSAKHPIHVRTINEQGSFIAGVYGWIDISDLNQMEFNSYKVTVTASALNYRKGPSTNYSILGVLRKGETYTIVQEIDGWGQLKEKIGWISLAYTKKL